MDLELITPPAARLVSLEQAKAHLRVEHAQDDSLIEALIDAAIDELDGRNGILRRALVTQTWDVRFCGFPGGAKIELPFPPLQSVTHIKYFDLSDAEQTFSAAEYDVHKRGMLGYVRLKATSDGWPSTYDRDDAVTVRFVAGYGAPEAVPKPIYQAVLIRVAELYAARGDDTEGGKVVSPGARIVASSGAAFERLTFRYRVLSW